MRLIDALEDNDDVGDVHANFDVDADVLERVAAGLMAGLVRRRAPREPRSGSLFAGQALSRLGDRIALDRAGRSRVLGDRRLGADLGLVVAAGIAPVRCSSRCPAASWATASGAASVMLASDGVRAVVQATSAACCCSPARPRSGCSRRWRRSTGPPTRSSGRR